MRPKSVTKDQLPEDSFSAVAKRLHCDESELAFNAKLEKVARAAVPRKLVNAAKPGKPQKVAKAVKSAAPEGPAKKKIRFILPGA